MEIYDLIEELMEDENIDRKKLSHLMCHAIKCKKDEKDILECLYREVYGNTLKPDLCKYLVDNMTNAEHTGAIWSNEDCKSVLKKLDYDIDDKPYTLDEFMATMNMEFYEHDIPLRKSSVNLEPSAWGRLADYALTKEPDKLVEYFFDSL